MSDPLKDDGLLRALEDLDDASSSSEWHECVAQLVGHLILCRADMSGWSEAETIDFVARLYVLQSYLAKGPPKAKGRAASTLKVRQTKDILSLYESPLSRARAIQLLADDDLYRRTLARAAAGDPAVLKIADGALHLEIFDPLIKRRAQDIAAKRVDAAAREGLAITRRPKRK